MGRFVLIAIMLAVGVTAIGLSGVNRAKAEPPSPCHYYGFCDE
jgi:hypothetical protein